MVMGTIAKKMAPVVRALQARGDRVEGRVCITSQHREMLQQVLDLFAITPDHDLAIMAENRRKMDQPRKARRT